MQTDALALTCRILLDHRILEQRREIERLRLHGFWGSYTKEALDSAMRSYNQDVPKCGCGACGFVGRDYEAAESQGCTFKPAWEALIAKHGLTVAYPVGDQVATIADYQCSPDDVHFVHAARGDWVFWSVGVNPAIHSPRTGASRSCSSCACLIFLRQ